ncbi:MAG: terpene cyclase/mutase family protein [Verrucomicrobia bacterium]|nr:terpene cyclase/mutase family protein [Verrucomicrobiota bacterium]
MSLHAQLTPEVLARLQVQRRVSSISSVVVAFLSVLLVALVLGAWFLPQWIVVAPDVIITQGKEIIDPPSKPRSLATLQHKPASPSARQNMMLVVPYQSNLAIPVPDPEFTTPSVDFGTGDDFGLGGLGNGPGEPGGPITSLPPDLTKRCSKADRLNRLAETGGTVACDEAVVKGLTWLKATQSADGSWTGQNQAAMTGLALLAYLGHCETPWSLEYGESCLRAITYLVDLGMKNHGKLSTTPHEKHWPYEHAIATYALAEATTFCKTSNLTIPNLPEITQQAGQFIINNQHASGGWDYAYQESGARGGDVSITAWQLQALKACKHTKLDFNNLERCTKHALAYIGKMQHPSGGIGYSSPNSSAGGDYFTLTGAGVLCLQMWDKGATATARDGARYISKHTRFEYGTRFADLYGHYYEAQVMMNRGGEPWRKYNALFRDQLLSHQSPDGSWQSPGDGTPLRAAAASYVGGSPMAMHYRTTLNILMLEVYYRFLPGTGGK